MTVTIKRAGARKNTASKTTLGLSKTDSTSASSVPRTVEIAAHFEPLHRLKAQADLKIEGNFIPVSFDLGNMVEQMTPEAGRLLEMTALDRIDLTIPHPTNDTYTEDYVVSRARSQAEIGFMDETNALFYLYEKLVKDETTLAEIGDRMLGWFQSGGFELFNGDESPGERVDLYERIMGLCVDPDIWVKGQPLFRGEPEYLDPKKIPKGLLLNGKPPRSVFLVGDVKDHRVQNEYAAIMCAEAFSTEANRLAKLRGAMPDSWAAIIGELDQLADKAREARKAAREAQRQKERNARAARTLRLNCVLKSKRLEMLVEHDFDTYMPTEETILQWYIDQFREQSMKDVVCQTMSEAQAADEASGWDMVAHPQLHTLELMSVVKGVLKREDTQVLLEGSTPTIEVQARVDSTGHEHLVIDGLFKPVTDQCMRYLMVRTAEESE